MAKIDLFRNATDFQPFSAGQVIFKEGESGDTMYVVIKGEVDIVIHDKTVGTIGEGDIVGEMALIDAKLRSATAIAKTDCKLVPIDRKRFTYLIQGTPYFAIQVMQIMADRLRRLDALI